MSKMSLGLVILAACSSGGTSLTDLRILVRDEGLAELSLLIEPAVSPDGRWIAYVRELKPVVLPDQTAEFGHDLYVAN